jgi:hypothetical protein
MLVAALLGARTVVSGLGGDEMVAVGSAEPEQAAVDKRENFDLPGAARPPAPSLNPRVRGSSPWRCTRSDLAV